MSVDITVYQYGKNVLYFFYNIAQRTLTEEWREIFRVDIELYQHGSCLYLPLKPSIRSQLCVGKSIHVFQPGTGDRGRGMSNDFIRISLICTPDTFYI